jgi:hypothetical protein
MSELRETAIKFGVELLQMGHVQLEAEISKAPAESGLSAELAAQKVVNDSVQRWAKQSWALAKAILAEDPGAQSTEVKKPRPNRTPTITPPGE